MSDDRKPARPAARSLDGVLDELRSVLSSPLTPDVSPSAPAPSTELPASSAPPADDLASLFPSAEPAPVEPPAAPVSFEIVTPAEIPAPEAAIPEPPVVEVPVLPPAPEPAPAAPPSSPGFVPPIPTGIETAPESWTLMTDAQPSPVPEPIVSGSSALAGPPPASWLQTDGALTQETPASAAPAEPAAFETAPVFSPEPTFNEPPPPAPAAPEIPIPMTIETREAPEVEPADLNDLEHAAAARPEGLVQIACLFPEGAEKTGQSFVNRLKETAARLKKPLVVQPVFLHTWSPDAVDIAAWAKSAALSGADAMFVIAPRASAPLFSKLAAEAANAGTTGRVVAAELVPSSALYADVLVDLKRKANGPR